MNRKRHIFPAFYFYPRPPRGGRRSRWSRGRGCRNFYPRPPRGGRRPELQCCCTKRRIFLSTPSARRATPSTTLPKSNTRNFYPRPPRGGRPRPRRRRCWRRSNFYPRPPRGGRRYSDVPLDDHVRISIHALREEGDLRAFASTLGALRISIHALREEGDRLWSTDTVGRIRFLSTPSARRATGLGDKWFQDHQISIHALREEGDQDSETNGFRIIKFLSTPSARRATQHSRFCYVVIQFLSTPSARRATGLGDKWFQDHQISIHALREEGDHSPASSAPMALYFYPRPPRGGRPGCTTADGNAEVISIHALREEGDPPARRWWRCRGYFYPRPPRGGRRA